MIFLLILVRRRALLARLGLPLIELDCGWSRREALTDAASAEEGPRDLEVAEVDRLDAVDLLAAASHVISVPWSATMRPDSPAITRSAAWTP